MSRFTSFDKSNKTFSESNISFKDINTNIMGKFVEDYNTTSKTIIKRTRRKTVSDKLITDELINKLSMKCATLNTRREIVEKLLKLNLSNAAMAKVINKTIPHSKATANSVAAIVNSIRKDNQLVDELLQEIEEL